MKTGDKVIITKEPSGVFNSNEVGKIGIICAIEEYENGECEYEVDTGKGNKFWYISSEFLLCNDFWHKPDEIPLEDKECILVVKYYSIPSTMIANARNGEFFYRDGEKVADKHLKAWAYMPKLPEFVELTELFYNRRKK